MFSRIAQGSLPWLPSPPAGFRKKAKALPNEKRSVEVDELASLARHDLDLNQLTILDRVTRELMHHGSISDPNPVKLAILSQGTTDYVAPAIRASALRHGLVLDSYEPPFGQALAEIMDNDSKLHAFDADIALVATTPESLGLSRSHINQLDGEIAISSAVAKLKLMVETLHRSGVRTVILQTLPLPADPWVGSYDRRAAGSLFHQIDAVNAEISAICESHNAVLFDADALAALVGRAAWHDAGLWNRAKLPFALDFVPLYAEKLCQTLRAIKGRASKCLVLDLDNTCWGGVIGDDGLEGIRIGQGSADGEAYLAVQNYALSLKERGIVLAVCSKNEAATAKLPFEKHPDMRLGLDDIAVFVANWTDKASNLAYIAKTLNIGVDALVFLDDNPAERERVRQELPEVSVPEVGDDPALFPSLVAQAGYFESVGLSEDDAKRAGQYKANAKRAVAMEAIGNYDDYLQSLEMVCTIAPFDGVGRTRIAQLINKSNQFNLTTRRYSEADVAAMEADPDIYTMQVRLQDKFGDNGMISVVAFRRDQINGRPAWICDTWLMSCRVLKRRVEEAVLNTAANAAIKEGVELLIGDYIPSEKNMMVEDHYKKLGFLPMEQESAKGSRWYLELADYSAPALPMRTVCQEITPS